MKILIAIKQIGTKIYPIVWTTIKMMIFWWFNLGKASFETKKINVLWWSITSLQFLTIWKRVDLEKILALNIRLKMKHNTINLWSVSVLISTFRRRNIIQGKNIFQTTKNYFFSYWICKFLAVRAMIRLLHLLIHSIAWVGE